MIVHSMGLSRVQIEIVTSPKSRRKTAGALPQRNPIGSLLKIVMGVYACEPSKGSEPGVGWNWAVQAALYGNEVHAITRKNNRVSIEATLARHPVPGLHFHYLDLPKPFLWMKRRSGYYGMLIYYYLWQVALGLTARRLHRSLGFDLAHHVTFVNDWMPSGLVLLNIPLIWGPVGGSTHMWPKQIQMPLASYARRYELSRRLVISTLASVDPFVSATRRRAARILVYTAEALNGIPAEYRFKASAIRHIAIAAEDIPPCWEVAPDDGTGPLRIVTGGRLVHWKGFDLLIEGLANVRGQGAETILIVTGDGPYRHRLEMLAASLDLDETVHFVGWLPSRPDVFRLIRQCHVYALMTLRDGPPVAILEAMAVGLPILHLDIGAIRELVPDTAGLKVPVHSRRQVIEGIAAALEWSMSNRQSLRNMGQAASAYVQQNYKWDEIGKLITSLYNDVGIPHGDQPD